MLQLTSDNRLMELQQQFNSNCYDNLTGSIFNGLSNYQFIPWQNYTVYYCTDKTKKAIEVLKHLQEKKLLTCNSVNKFIELVEEISNIL